MDIYRQVGNLRIVARPVMGMHHYLRRRPHARKEAGFWMPSVPLSRCRRDSTTSCPRPMLYWIASFLRFERLGSDLCACYRSTFCMMFCLGNRMSRPEARVMGEAKHLLV